MNANNVVISVSFSRKKAVDVAFNYCILNNVPKKDRVVVVHFSFEPNILHIASRFWVQPTTVRRTIYTAAREYAAKLTGIPIDNLIVDGKNSTISSVYVLRKHIKPARIIQVKKQVKSKIEFSLEILDETHEAPLDGAVDRYVIIYVSPSIDNIARMYDLTPKLVRKIVEKSALDFASSRINLPIRYLRVSQNHSTGTRIAIAITE